MAQLDRLLELDPDSREAELAQLATSDPPLHARLVKLCSAATDENSHLLAQPVIAGLRLAQQGSSLLRQAGEVFAGYRLVRELGRGGMAVVWLAEREDGVVKRPVALKLPLCAVSPLESQRFAREKDVLAALSHPHIARMYDAGVAPTGQPYIVLEFIDGIPITAHCDRDQLTIEARLRLFLDVLAAVDHAHTHLIVHRDLKPSNILVDRQGAVKLLDFGIARLLPDPAAEAPVAELTQHGGLALTPLYAAPEQVRAQPISTLTDVYVLGAVLHELLAGTVPHALSVRARPSLAQWVEAVSRPIETHVRNAPMDDEAALRRGLVNAKRLRIALTGDLDVIVQKAMRHAPSQRYASVAHLADDVRRYLARQPLAARPASLWYAARLFTRRHRAASVVAALGAAASLTAGLIALQKQSESRMYEARSAAVRDFMYDFVNDVEPNELQPDAPVPFIDMLGAAVVRARGDFRDRPQLQGELLSELGRMYGTVGEPQKSAQIVAEALAILERSAPENDPALNKARTFQASILLDENEIERARALASQARDACTRDNVDCTKARSYALTLLARIALMDGLPHQALTTQRKAVEETKRAFGRQNEMTVISLRALAVVARNSGQLIESAAVMTEAVEIAAHVTLRRSDRLILERTMAVGDLDMGRYRAARERLTKLIPGVRDSEERALQLRLLANALLAEGVPRAALDAADSALKRSDAGAGDAEPQFARQARARALSLLGEAELALADMTRVVDGLRALDYDEASTEVLRARRFHSEMLLRAGRIEEAWGELQPLLARLDVAREVPSLEAGQMLDLAACALRELKRFPEAAAMHMRARIELQKQLPADHPFLVRNALYKEAVTEDRDEFKRKAELAKQVFGPDSLWGRLIDAELHAESCPKTGLELCVFIL